MGLTPDQLWRLTPRELRCAATAFKRKVDHEQRMLAWACANLMNCWVKKKVTPQMLIKGRGHKFLPVVGKEGVASYYRAKKARFGSKD